MKKLHLMNNGYLTNAAMLLFANDPEEWQLGAFTKIGFFESDSELRYQDEIHGSLLDQIDRIIETVHLKYMKAKITYEGMQRIERYFVPDGALREALLNALCHKDYARGIPIQVSVYDDRLYIANCGRSLKTGRRKSSWRSILQNPSIRILPMSTTLLALLRAGAAVSKKFANPVGRTVRPCPSMI